MFLLHPALNFFLNEHQIFTGFFPHYMPLLQAKVDQKKLVGVWVKKKVDDHNAVMFILMQTDALHHRAQSKHAVIICQIRKYKFLTCHRL